MYSRDLRKLEFAAERSRHPAGIDEFIGCWCCEVGRGFAAPERRCLAGERWYLLEEEVVERPHRTE